MPADFLTPILTTSYVSVMSILKERDVDGLTMCVSDPTNIPTSAMKWNRAGTKFQEYSGAAWADVILSLAGGGTGSATAAGARTNLGLGTMAVQDNNAVNITGGTIGTAVNIDASRLTSGAVGTARLGSGIAGATKYLRGDQAWSGVSGADIDSGSVPLARGGTHADLSATGGAGKFLKQLTAGADITVANPAIADLSDASNVVKKDVVNTLAEILTVNKGLTFPSTQVPSTDVNTLDDYEEGSWTPVVGGSGGTTGQSYGIQVGRYVKIGKLVCAEFYVQLSAKGTVTTNVEIQGLPFTSENTANQYRSSMFNFFGLNTAVSLVGFQLGPNSTAVTLLITLGTNTDMFVVDTSYLGNSSGFMGQIVYRATQ